MKAKILEAALLVLEHCIKGGWGYIPRSLIKDVNELIAGQVEMEDIEQLLDSVQEQGAITAEEVMFCASKDYVELISVANRHDALCAFVDDYGLAAELQAAITGVYDGD